MAGFRSQFSYLFVVYLVNCLIQSKIDRNTRNTIEEIYLYATWLSWFLANLWNVRTENLPMQWKQLRLLLKSMFSISCSLPANGWKRLFSTIRPAPQISCFFLPFQYILKYLTEKVCNVLCRTRIFFLRFASQQKFSILSYCYCYFLH